MKIRVPGIYRDTLFIFLYIYRYIDIWISFSGREQASVSFPELGGGAEQHTVHVEPGIMAHTCHPTMWEAGTGEWSV